MPLHSNASQYGINTTIVHWPRKDRDKNTHKLSIQNKSRAIILTFPESENIQEFYAPKFETVGAIKRAIFHKNMLPKEPTSELAAIFTRLEFPGRLRILSVSVFPTLSQANIVYFRRNVK